jgi:hypothetical protein
MFNFRQRMRAFIVSVVALLIAGCAVLQSPPPTPRPSGKEIQAKEASLRELVAAASDRSAVEQALVKAGGRLNSPPPKEQTVASFPLFSSRDEEIWMTVFVHYDGEGRPTKCEVQSIALATCFW